MIRNLCPAGQASRNGEGRIPVSLDPDKFLNFTRSQLQLIYFSVKCVTGLNDEAEAVLDTVAASVWDCSRLQTGSHYLNLEISPPKVLSNHRFQRNETDPSHRLPDRRNPRTSMGSGANQYP